MRLWSIHPHYLDRQGLLAAWREGLLAQAVLLGRTKGYTNHPQLFRFRESKDPAGALGAYLKEIADEAHNRNYRFDQEKIERINHGFTIDVTEGQLEFERQHLLAKILVRNPLETERIASLSAGPTTPHPIFHAVHGPIEHWERGSLDRAPEEPSGQQA